MTTFTRRALNTQTKKEVGDGIYRENIFYTRYLIQDKTYNVMVDRGSYVNITSTTLIEKLRLPILKLPRPYNIQWLNNSDEVKVTRKVLVSFFIGKYKDEVLCDIVSMHVEHLLLG